MPRARSDLDGIKMLSTRKWGLANWAQRAVLLDEAFDAISEFPGGGQDRSDLVEGMRSRLVKPHVIFFIERDDAVAILRIVDGRRDLPKLKFN